MNLKIILLKFIKRCYAIPSSIIQNFIRTIHIQNIYISQANVVALTHQNTFSEYKNKYSNQEIVIIATGPGVNKAIFFKKCNLNYYFSQDYNANKSYIDKLVQYKNITKFYGQLPVKYYGLNEVDISRCILPESLILKHNAKKYYTYSKWPLNPLFFNPNIDKTWLADGGSVVFSAMQFALFTNPKKIYLVGCDCTAGHFDNPKKNINLSNLIKSWKEIKKFAEIYYPDTEIISINPVGLKGIFKDLYQDVE